VAAPVIASSSVDAVVDTSDTDLAPAAPSGTATGDMLIAFLVCAATRTYSPPSGWTTLITSPDSANDTTYAFAKVAASGDTSGTYTFTASAGFNFGRVWVGRITGATATVGDIVIDAGPGNAGSGFTAQGLDLVTAVADNLVLYACGTSAASSSPPGGWNEESDLTDANSRQLGVYSATQATAGTVTGPGISIGFTSWTTAGIGIPPAGGGGGSVSRPPYRRNYKFFRKAG
jgi:hypothetical protein